MKYTFRFLAVTFFFLLAISLQAQDKTTSLVNYSPNSNFIVIKVKSAKEFKTGIENHPLKKLLYNDRTKDLFDDLFQSGKKDDAEVESKEEKEESKKSVEKLFASFTGEMVLTIAYEKIEEAKFDISDEVTSALIAQVDTNLFQEFIKLDIAIQEKNKDKKTISKKQHENIEYYSVVGESSSRSSFSAVINDIGILGTNEEVFKKVISAIVKKVSFENGLQKNEKFYAFLNANQNKDILLSADFTPIFKNTLSKEPEGASKVSLEAFKLDKLFQINASFDLDEKGDSLDVTLNALDDGILQFATLVNNDFVPSAFISADVSSYTKAFFSLAEFKKKLIEFLTKISPGFDQQYQGLLAMAKTNFQFDIEAFFDSIGDDYEGFSAFHKEGLEESFFINKLKNQNNFTTNFSSILNNALVKQTLSANFSINENKEGGNQFWVLTTKTSDPAVPEINFALGSMDSYGFFSMPGNMAQKHIAQMKKNPENKLSSSAVFNATRAMYPSKLAFFSFALTKDMIISLKSKLKAQQTNISKISPNLEKMIKILDDIKAEDFKGCVSYGMWRDINKLTFSVKLNNK